MAPTNIHVPNYFASILPHIEDFPVISQGPYGNRVVKVSDGVVIKYGVGITKGEADNQSVAWKLLSPHTVRIPRVFDFLTLENRGYIVMEYVEGENAETMDSSILAEKVASILSKLH